MIYAVLRFKHTKFNGTPKRLFARVNVALAANSLTQVDNLLDAYRSGTQRLRGVDDDFVPGYGVEVERLWIGTEPQSEGKFTSLFDIHDLELEWVQKE